jgi:hypothetical protein
MHVYQLYLPQHHCYHATVQAVIIVSLQWPMYTFRLVDMGFVADKVHLGKVFFLVLLCQLSVH